MKKTFGLAVGLAVLLCTSAPAYAKTTYNITRLAGTDRYETSVKIADSFQSGSLQNIILASGKDFPDALGGSVLSKKYNAPILLLNSTVDENSDALNYIKSHLSTSGNIYVLGGTSSVSDDILDHITQMGYKNITRLGGANRFDTNKYIISSLNVKTGTPIVLANGWGFADALSISSIAASKGYPIFMVNTDNLPDETKNLISTIKPSKVYVIGGQASVSQDAIDELKTQLSYLKDEDITRLGGQTRYDTSMSICENFDFNSSTAVLANGENFPDALSGSALASKLNAPIILTDGNDLSNQKTYIDKENYRNVYLLGGLGSIDLPVEYLLKAPSAVPQTEKDYVNSLKSYCESYENETSNTADELNETYTDATSTMSELNSASSIEEIRQYLDQMIQVLTSGSSSLTTYKSNLTVLRDDVSKLSVPDGLEVLNKQYLDSINKQIDSVNQSIDYTNSCIEILNSIEEGIDAQDQDKIETESQKLQDLSQEMNSITDVQDSSDIYNLYIRLTTAMDNLNQQ
ncbi:cell wall-binding repeat-containing protein [Clostridium luticellarii]|uniref:N-acetylmuramoyl-L-alanine amidase LytC n=1 Tax=Clostridium luticellarii TaxID=1691940 RepID=A0A2T0BP82_9CLOT|nr:cell wall-binding repeat-containing protein [Clostridium luticellarii]PRR85680.1 N-acetylmuramoyl-L-alanine amidase LytC precursor [Clostridium luticellarii]